MLKCSDLLNKLEFITGLMLWLFAILMEILERPMLGGMCHEPWFRDFSTRSFNKNLLTQRGGNWLLQVRTQRVSVNLGFYTYPERKWHGITMTILRKELQILAIMPFPDVSVRRFQDWVGLSSCPYPTSCYTHTKRDFWCLRVLFNWAFSSV